MASTSLAFLPTEHFKENQSEFSLQSHADQVKTCWNDNVTNDSGDYRLFTNVVWEKPVKVPESVAGTTACDAIGEVEEYVRTNYSVMLKLTGGVMVIDDRVYSPDAGCAGDDIVLVGDIGQFTFGKGLVSHEAGHLHSADHTDHRQFGWGEYTAMGNEDSRNCGGGETPTWKTRKNTYSDCTVEAIRSYLNQ